MEFGPLYVDSLLRWGHILSGIVWIGFLYFFNFVNGPFGATLDAETKKKVVPELMFRCLWWFRWGAMATLLFGLALFAWGWVEIGSYTIAGDEGGLTGRGRFIMWGMLMAVIMWFNVWFIIWPAQKKIIPAIGRGEAPPAGLPARAALFSRINTYLSGPMLMLMVMAGHFGTAFHYGHLGLAIVIGLAVIHLMIKAGPKVGKP